MPSLCKALGPSTSTCTPSLVSALARAGELGGAEHIGGLVNEIARERNAFGDGVLGLQTPGSRLSDRRSE